MIQVINNLDVDYHVPIPEPPQFESEILFAGNKITDQFWTRTPVPRSDSFKSTRAKVEFWEKEFQRCFVDGQWAAIKGDLLWLTPQYYFFLKHGKIIGKPEGPQFRKKRWKHSLFKWLVKTDPRLIGSYTIKNRRDGETINAMSDILQEAIPDDAGLYGIQSKTMDDAKDVCWRHLMHSFRGLHRMFRYTNDGSPIWSGTTDPKRALNFRKTAKTISSKIIAPEDYDEEDAQETTIYYKATVSNAFDGREMRKIILDEFNKWEEDSALQAYLTYIDCVLMGRSRRGLFDIFSSPSETQGRHNEEAKDFWEMCNPAVIDPKTGVTKSRCLRWFSSPLEGIESFYDKYGNADADEIYEHLMVRRDAVPKDKKMSEVRKYPLNPDEAFNSFDNVNQWSNSDGITARKIYLMRTSFKEEVNEANEIIQSPKYYPTRLEWKDMVPDTIVQPFLHPMEDAFTGKVRFLFTEFPQNLPPLYNIFRPPTVIDSVTGIDPYDYRRPKNTSRASKGAASNFRFTNMFMPGKPRKAIPFIYLGRPDRPKDFFEDMIKACVFTQSMVQTEAKNQGILDHFEDRGYWRWLMPADYDGGDPDQKGNSPNANTTFVDDLCALIDGHFAVPYEDDEDFLLNVWFEQLLEDVEKFDRSDTHRFDLTMGLGQAFYGAQKWLMRLNRKHRNSPHSKELAEALAGFI